MAGARFQSLCSGCHGTDGNGGEHAPSILPSLATKNDEGITLIVREGVPRKGMPAFKQLPEADLRALVAYMRTMQQRRGGRRGASRPAAGAAYRRFRTGRDRRSVAPGVSCSYAPTISAFICCANPVNSTGG